MNFLDVRTVLIGHFFTTLLCALTLWIVWAQNRGRFAGTGWWLADFSFQTLAAALVLLRSILPDLLSIVVSNTLAIAGALLGYIGLCQFTGKKVSQVHNYLYLFGFAAIHAYFTYIHQDLSIRNLNLSLGLFFMCFQCAWLVLHQVDPETRRITKGVGVVFAIFGSVNFARIILTLAYPSPNNDFFHAGLFDTIIVMTYQILLILLAFHLINAVNLRLIAGLQVQEEKYAAAFRSSPYVIMLTRLLDGKILDANKVFFDTLGYTHAEAIDRTTLDLHLWVREEDRAEMVKELREGRKILNREYMFRKKSGEILIGSLSADIVNVNSTPWILSSLEDITRRKDDERSMLVIGEKFRELVQSAPDAILGIEQNGAIQFSNPAAASLFGYHSAELLGMSVERLVPLQFNSEGPGELEISIPSPQVRRMELTAHHKDGREIPVDINLGYIHIEKGIQVVAFIRDISEQRKMRNDLQIANQSLMARIAEVEKLQSELREQVIRDPLTGLYNRRHLQDVLKREFSRAEREKYTISIIMLDMDELKKINDTYGHRAGDQALQYLATHMQRMVRLEDLACRLGGDEFAVILSRANPRDAIRRVNEWRNFLKEHPLDLESGGSVTIRFSAGVASYPLHATSMDEVSSYADVALYRAKARGRNCTIEYA